MKHRAPIGHCLRLSLVLAVFAVGCSEAARSREDARRVLLEDLGEQQFLPRYRSFEKRAAALQTSAREFCDALSADGLEATRDAWWSARTPWKENELLAFGPYTDEPLRYGPKIDFWPARESSIESVLNGDQTLDAESVSGFGTVQRGLPVIEYLLYTPDTDVLAAFSDVERRCPYLVALTEDLAALARGMRRAWDPEAGNYLGELVEAGRESEAFETLDMAFGEIVNRLVFSVENIRGDRLGAPLGNRSEGTPQPTSVESRFSDRSLLDARDILRGVERVCVGGEDMEASLARYLDDTVAEHELAKQLRSRVRDAREALEAVPETLADSVVEEPESVQHAIDALGELQRILQADIINALGLTLTFNDNDGD